MCFALDVHISLIDLVRFAYYADWNGRQKMYVGHFADKKIVELSESGCKMGAFLFHGAAHMARSIPSSETDIPAGLEERYDSKKGIALLSQTPSPLLDTRQQGHNEFGVSKLLVSD